MGYSYSHTRYVTAHTRYVTALRHNSAVRSVPETTHASVAVRSAESNAEALHQHGGGALTAQCTLQLLLLSSVAGTPTCIDSMACRAPSACVRAGPLQSRRPYA